MTEPSPRRHPHAHPTAPNSLSARLQLVCRLAVLLACCATGGPLVADQLGTSNRWDVAALRQKIRPLKEAPAEAQALLSWLQSDTGAPVLASLVREGRVQRQCVGHFYRREAGAAGYLRADGGVVMLRALVFSQWYGPNDNANVAVGKASAGVPWAIHTHSWGNSMSGSVRGITDDFAYATAARGAPGILICLPLRERDNSELPDSGRLQMIVPTPEGIACFEGRWQRTGGHLALIENSSAARTAQTGEEQRRSGLGFRRDSRRSSTGG